MKWVIVYFEFNSESNCEYIGVPDQTLVETMNRFIGDMMLRGWNPTITAINQIEYDKF